MPAAAVVTQGQQFGDWRIERYAGRHPGSNSTMVDVTCLCCGEEYTRLLSAIKGGRTQRCADCSEKGTTARRKLPLVAAGSHFVAEGVDRREECANHGECLSSWARAFPDQGGCPARCRYFVPLDSMVILHETTRQTWHWGDEIGEGE